MCNENLDINILGEFYVWFVKLYLRFLVVKYDYIYIRRIFIVKGNVI